MDIQSFSAQHPNTWRGTAKHNVPRLEQIVPTALPGESVSKQRRLCLFGSVCGSCSLIWHAYEGFHATNCFELRGGTYVLVRPAQSQQEVS